MYYDLIVLQAVWSSDDTTRKKLTIVNKQTVYLKRSFSKLSCQQVNVS